MTLAAEDRLSRALAALADPTRRQIVATLARRDATVGELAQPYAMSVQAVSKHIKVLEDAGLVLRVTPGPRSARRLDPGVLRDVGSWVDEYRTQAEGRFARLDAVLEELVQADVAAPPPEPTPPEPTSPDPSRT